MSSLAQQAGYDAYFIKVICFDETLGAKIGVTIIATGFEHKDPFKPTPKPKEEKKPEEKIVLHLSSNNVEEKKVSNDYLTLFEEVPRFARDGSYFKNYN